MTYDIQEVGYERLACAWMTCFPILVYEVLLNTEAQSCMSQHGQTDGWADGYIATNTANNIAIWLKGLRLTTECRQGLQVNR